MLPTSTAGSLLGSRVGTRGLPLKLDWSLIGLTSTGSSVKRVFVHPLRLRLGDSTWLASWPTCKLSSLTFGTWALRTFNWTRLKRGIHLRRQLTGWRSQRPLPSLALLSSAQITPYTKVVLPGRNWEDCWKVRTPYRRRPPSPSTVRIIPLDHLRDGCRYCTWC